MAEQERHFLKLSPRERGESRVAGRGAIRGRAIPLIDPHPPAGYSPCTQGESFIWLPSITLFLLAVLVIASGCRSEERPYQAESTKRMAEILEAIAADTDAYPRRNAHANKARVRSLRAVMPPTDPRQRVQYEATLGQELLRAGDNKAAIALFTQMLDRINQRPGLFENSYRLGVQDFLAISYLRLGEQENCIANHTIERCLLPISEGGVHTLERGSREAILVYTDLLNADPNDLNALWLLNIASMTLGEYPDGVPEAWRIPPDALQAEYDIKRFIDVSKLLGVDVVGLSGGAVMEDLNGDGYLDVMASSWGLRDQIRYFESTADGHFADRTGEAGLTGIVGGLNLIHADYNNDGHPDVLVLRGAWLAEGHPNSLLKNNGDGTFDDVTEAAGLFSLHPTQTASWGDYDNDGDLDLFIGNESNPEAGVHPCELYRNNGDGTFTEVAAEVGLDVIGYVKAVVWGDYDNDGRLDLYLSRWTEPNLLFHNDGPAASGLWRFTETATVAGVHEPIDSFPVWFWDYDNDGWLDLFVSGWRAAAGDVAAEYLGLPGNDEKPRLYRNNADGTFTDVAAATRLDRVMYTMGSNFGDLDNDGWLDFYVGTGDPDFRALMPNRMFRNSEGDVFQEVTASGRFGHLQKGHGVAFGDLDNDGDQDLYAVIGGAFEGDVFNNVLFENPGHGNHWITLHLEGTTSNRSALGARIAVNVETDAGLRSIHRVVTTGGSFGSSTLQQEIGLGRARAIRTIEVTWPATGAVQRFEDVAMDQIVRIREGASAVEVVTRERLVLAHGGPRQRQHEGGH